MLLRATLHLPPQGRGTAGMKLRDGGRPREQTEVIHPAMLVGQRPLVLTVVAEEALMSVPRLLPHMAARESLAGMRPRQANAWVEPHP